jgi:hypothetical protein
MGEKMLAAIGYAYVRQTNKVMGSSGGLGLGKAVEDLVEGGHRFNEGASAVGSAMGARTPTPPPPRHCRRHQQHRPTRRRHCHRQQQHRPSRP